MSTPAPLRLAVADNSPLIRGVFQGTPATEYVVRAQARSRQELERAAESFPLDAILCADDLSGHMVGVETLRQLRESSVVPPETAFILLLDNANRSHVLACTQAKPDAILLKPFSLHMLTTRLERAVQLRLELAGMRVLDERHEWAELLAESRRRQSEPGGASQATLQYEAKALLQLGRRSEVDELLARVLQATPGLLWVEEAVARRELEEGDWSAAERRLLRLIAQHPTHIEAQSMLYQFKMERGDREAAQTHLAQIAHFTGNQERSRELGHLAILNGDLDAATRAYTSVLRQEGNARAFQDLVNYIRALLLKGEGLSASHAVSQYGALRGMEGMLGVVGLFVEGARERASGQLGQAQAEVFSAVRALGTFGDELVPPELKLLAVELCLNTRLMVEATQRSGALLEEKTHPLPTLQHQWLQQLHRWALELPDDSMLPKGLRGTARLG